MKVTSLDDIDPAVRALFLITVAISYPTWSFGFELGVFGRLFFEKVFIAWSISTALFFLLLFIPKTKLRVPKLAWYATVFPSLWLVLALMVRAAPDVQLLGQALTAVGLVAYVACFPYVIYLSVSVAYPELLKLKTPGPWILISAIIVSLAVIGFIFGRNHFYFLTCADFEVSGNFVPENCVLEPDRERGSIGSLNLDPGQPWISRDLDWVLRYNTDQPGVKRSYLSTRRSKHES